MTQALLNSLNIQDTGSYSANLNTPEDTSMLNFATILDSQNSLNNEITENSDIVNAIKETAIETLGSIKTAMLSESETIAQIIKDAIEEFGVEKVFDLTLAEELAPQETSEVPETSETTDITEEASTPEKENAEEITNEDITNEDPTMQKELTLLESPTAGILLQSQTKTHSSLLNEDNEKTSQNTQSDMKVVSNNTNNDKNLNFTKNIIVNSDNSTKSNTTTETKTHEAIDEKMVKELNIEKVESESSDNNNHPHDLMKNQTPEEQGIKAVIQGEIKYEEVSAKAVHQTKTQTNKPAAEVSASKIIDQISKQMNNINNGSKVNIVLNPESLGKVILQIINSKEGLTAMFTVGSQDTKSLLMNGIDGLKETLLSQGVAVDNISVKVEETNESEYKQDWTEQEESKGGNKEHQSKRQKDNPKRFEQMMFELNNKEEEIA